jgi:hypothetical protein
MVSRFFSLKAGILGDQCGGVIPMDIGSIVAWIQLALWLVTLIGITIAYTRKLRSGETNLPSILGSPRPLWAILVVGLLLSFGSLYFNYRPRVIRVEKIVEKPVDRVVEKVIPAECPKPQPFADTPTRPIHHGKQATATKSALPIPPGTTINATTNAPDSAAVGVNTGTVTVNPPVNPNAWKVTYSCQGNERDEGQTPEAATAVNVNFGKETATLKIMEELNNSKDYSALLGVCQEKIKSVSEWLTPYLFCSLGYAFIGNATKARELLAEYDKRTGPAYAEEPCKQISQHLHKHL